MPVWQWLVDSAGVLLLLVLLYGLALVVRRRVLSRHGGTFELSYRVRPETGRTRLASRARPLLRRDPRVVPDLLARAAAQAGPGSARRWPTSAAASPEGVEQMSLYPDHVVICCTHAPTARSSWR